MPKIELAGKKFYRLSVIRDTGERHKRQVLWLCQCDCGNIHYVLSHYLVKGEVKSCGCLKKEILKTISITHGMTGTPTYKSWRQLIRRCFDKKSIQYENYGGRGITVCDKWKSFKNFYADMGNRPSSKHSIDRIDVNGNYELSNCKWSTMKQQQNNKSNNIKILFKGESKTISEWSDTTGIRYATLWDRINKGYSIERIFKEVKNDSTNRCN